MEKPICTFLGEKLPPKTLLPDGWKKMEAEKPSMSFKFQKRGKLTKKERARIEATNQTLTLWIGGVEVGSLGGRHPSKNIRGPHLLWAEIMVVKVNLNLARAVIRVEIILNPIQ